MALQTGNPPQEKTLRQFFAARINELFFKEATEIAKIESEAHSLLKRAYEHHKVSETLYSQYKRFETEYRDLALDQFIALRRDVGGYPKIEPVFTPMVNSLVQGEFYGEEFRLPEAFYLKLYKAVRGNKEQENALKPIVIRAAATAAATKDLLLEIRQALQGIPEKDEAFTSSLKKMIDETVSPQDWLSWDYRQGGSLLFRMLPVVKPYPEQRDALTPIVRHYVEHTLENFEEEIFLYETEYDIKKMSQMREAVKGHAEQERAFNPIVQMFTQRILPKYIQYAGLGGSIKHRVPANTLRDLRQAVKGCKEQEEMFTPLIEPYAKEWLSLPGLAHEHLSLFKALQGNREQEALWMSIARAHLQRGLRQNFWDCKLFIHDLKRHPAGAIVLDNLQGYTFTDLPTTDNQKMYGLRVIFSHSGKNEHESEVIIINNGFSKTYPVSSLISSWQKKGGGKGRVAESVLNAVIKTADQDGPAQRSAQEILQELRAA